MLAQIPHQSIDILLVSIVHTPRFESVALRVEKQSMHVILVIKLLEVEAAQVDDVARVVIRLFVIDVHYVFLQYIMARYPRLRQFSDL